MPWLLLGLYTVHEPRPGVVGLAGALLYGVAFTYFAHTTLYTLSERALRQRWLPRGAPLLFVAGILCNLVLALLPAPDVLQTLGSTARNLGLIAMGHAILLRRPRTSS